MNKTDLFRRTIGRLFFLFFCSIFLAGCAAQKRICPAMKDTTEATAALKEYSVGIKPFRATGSCGINYIDEKGKKNAQSFPVRIWFESSNKFCLYGDVAFDPKGMSFAIDGDEYWVYAKLFGVYTKGRIDELNENYFASPAVFLDFLQPSNNCSSLYMTQANKEYNILICKDSRRCMTKKIFIDRCRQLVKKIEYLNCSGNPVVTIELDEYKNIAGQGSFIFPRKLAYKYYRGKDVVDQRQIKLDSVKNWQPGEQQMKALFTPPDVNTIKKETN